MWAGQERQEQSQHHVGDGGFRCAFFHDHNWLARFSGWRLYLMRLRAYVAVHHVADASLAVARLNKVGGWALREIREFRSRQH